eukprot:2096159-Pyramimonas_sp.AAC.1
MIDAWSWGADHDMDRPYFSCTATLANVWRSCGMPAKVFQAAKELSGVETATRLFRNLPGRCLRGRWGSVGSVEEKILQGRELIGSVFRAACGLTDEVLRKLGVAKAKAKAKPAADPKAAPNRKTGLKVSGEDEEQEHRQKNKQYRYIAAQAASDPVYIATVQISFVAKGPFLHLLHWIEKRKKEHANASATRAPEPYLGETPYSLLAGEKGEQVTMDIARLLTDDARNDAAAWGAVWGLLPNHLHSKARLLIVSLVLRGAAEWHYRVYAGLRSYPLCLLRVLDYPKDARYDARQNLARTFLDESAVNLHSNTSDVSLKLRMAFRPEWEEMAASGQCPTVLWTWLVLFRAAIPIDTQDVEGFNSILQLMSDRAPPLP